MDILVSVVVPIYNVEAYLERCMNSIVNQTYRNLEIILVDDGSTDRSPMICDEWAQRDKRIQTIHKENSGAGMARNTGMDLAAGKYILFIDSDDYIDVTLIEKCVKNAEEHQSDVVYYGRNNVYGDSKMEAENISCAYTTYCGDAIRNEFLPYLFTYELGFGVSAWGRMHNLCTINQYGLRFVSEREIISEDAYFSLKLFSKISTVSIVPECLYFYCYRDASFSRSYQKGKQKHNNHFLLKSMECIDQEGLPEKVKTHLKARYHGMTLGTLMQIIRSELSGAEKKVEIKSILRDPVLESTLTEDVIRLDAAAPGFFWKVLKHRCYPLCYVLLLCNSFR